MSSRRRVPLGVAIVGAVAALATQRLVPDEWLPADKTMHDLAMAGLMLGALLVVVAVYLLTRKRDG
ncbi:MAG: hypothetical protein ACYTHK_05550 [Planctomycetota bacterium]